MYDKLYVTGHKTNKGSEGSQTIKDDGTHAIIGGEAFIFPEQNIWANDIIVIHAGVVGEDKLRITDLLGGEETKNKLNAAFDGNFLTLSMNGSEFAKVVWEGKVIVSDHTYENGAAFYQAHDSASNQDAVLNALLQSMGVN